MHHPSHLLPTAIAVLLAFGCKSAPPPMQNSAPAPSMEGVPRPFGEHPVVAGLGTASDGARPAVATLPASVPTSANSSPDPLPQAFASARQTMSAQQIGRIIDRPIPFPPERVAATRKYIAAHYAPEHQGTGDSGIEFEPRMIVLHCTEVGSLQATLNTFSGTKLPAARSEIASGGDLNVSSQFVVDQDGTIYRLMPENRMARHTIGLNLSAIGVENVASDERHLQSAQAAANAWLVRHLKERYPKIEYVIGHHEYGRFRGSGLWWEKDPRYFTHKKDPGDAFMQAVRAQVRDLRLSSNP